MDRIKRCTASVCPAVIIIFGLFGPNWRVTGGTKTLLEEILQKHRFATKVDKRALEWDCIVS